MRRRWRRGCSGSRSRHPVRRSGHGLMRFVPGSPHPENLRRSGRFYSTTTLRNSRRARWRCDQARRAAVSADRSLCPQARRQLADLQQLPPRRRATGQFIANVGGMGHVSGLPGEERPHQYNGRPHHGVLRLFDERPGFAQRQAASAGRPHLQGPRGLLLVAGHRRAGADRDEGQGLPQAGRTAEAL